MGDNISRELRCQQQGGGTTEIFHQFEIAILVIPVSPPESAKRSIYHVRLSIYVINNYALLKNVKEYSYTFIVGHCCRVMYYG